MAEYPKIEHGLNKFSADVFNRLMDDLRTGESKWSEVLGLLRDRTGGAVSETAGLKARLCIIGNSVELDQRSLSEGGEYHAQYIYEWMEVSTHALRAGMGNMIGGGGGGDNYPLGIDFWTDAVYHGSGDVATHGIHTDPEKWYDTAIPAHFVPHAIDSTNPSNIASTFPWATPIDGNQPSVIPGSSDARHKRMWRFADHTDKESFLYGGAMNIAEASTNLFDEYEAIGKFIWPGTRLQGDCIDDYMNDITIKPIKKGSLVFMYLLPFLHSPSLSGGDEGEIYDDSPIAYINCFQVANPIEACCAAPDGDGIAAGNVAYFGSGTGKETKTDSDFRYDEATETLHVPNISTSGSVAHTGYSTTANDPYLSPLHRGRHATTELGARALFQPWIFGEKVRTKFASINGGNASNTGQLNVAIYNSVGGIPTTKVAGSDVTITGAGTSDSATAYDVTLPAGAYWIGCCVNTGTIKIHCTTASNASTVGYVPTATADFDTQWAIWQSSSDMTSLPTTISGVSELEVSTATIPRIGLEFQSV